MAEVSNHQDQRELAEVRSLFPIMESRAYLFAGALSPAATPVRDAMEEWADRWMFDPIEHRSDYFVDWGVLKDRFAELLNASRDEIAITDTTSRGLNLATQMIQAPAGSNVVVDATTYPSGTYSWFLPEKEHVEVRIVDAENGIPRLDEFESAVDSNTIAVSVSHICRVTGFRHDLDSLTQLAHDHGAYLIVDAAQSAGAVEIDVKKTPIDFLSCGVMKWLLGPPGVALLYAGREVVDAVAPPQVGPVGLVGGPHAPLERPPPYKPAASRLELGVGDLPGVAGAAAGIEILLSVGIGRVEEHVVDLSGYLINGLYEREIEVSTPTDPRRRGGVVAFASDSPEELRLFLRERGIDVWGYPDQRRMRADPHVYNNHDDVDRLLAGIDEFRRKKEPGVGVVSGSDQGVATSNESPAA